MSACRVLRWMSDLLTCQHSGISIPECSCAECCQALLWRYAPALLEFGPLEQLCCVPMPAMEPVPARSIAGSIP